MKFLLSSTSPTSISSILLIKITIIISLSSSSILQQMSQKSLSLLHNDNKDNDNYKQNDSNSPNSSLISSSSPSSLTSSSLDSISLNSIPSLLLNNDDHNNNKKEKENQSNMIDISTIVYNNNNNDNVSYIDNNNNNNNNNNDNNKSEIITTTTTMMNDEINDYNTTDQYQIVRLEKPKWLKDNQNDDNNNDYKDDDDYDDDDEDDDYYDNNNNNNTNNICTAGYFFDRIIPDDYPFEISKDVKHINETIERLNRMYTFTNKMLERLNPFLREMVSRMSDYLYESQLDSNCMVALFRVFRAINHRESWAMNFLDASGSILVGGFQQGMFVSLGEFDQCLEIESDSLETSNNIIYGQYCLLKPVVPLPENFNQGEPIAETNVPRVKKFLNDEYLDTYLGLYKFMQRTFLRVGLCLPHKCERQSVENAINRILVRKTGMSVQVGPECVKATDNLHINVYQIIFLSLFTLLLILIILSTIYEIIYRHLFENRQQQQQQVKSQKISKSKIEIIDNNNKQYKDHHQQKQDRRISLLYSNKPIIVQILTSFSIIRNTRHLFDNNNNASIMNEQIYRYPQLDTMRLLLIIFFFITNVYYYTMLFAPMIIKRFYVQGPLQFISEKKYFFIRMYYLIDVFVVFSGIALSISFKRKTFKFINYLIRNYIRYTLPIIISIGLIYIVPLFGSGPLWHLFDQTMTQPCKENLLSALFFINNFQNNIEEMCNLPTVFVSMIFQLKLLSPIILIINYKYINKNNRNKYFILLLSLSSIGNLFYRFYFNLKIPYEHRTMKTFIEIKQSIMFYLFNPFSHLQPLIIGLWVGYLINKEKKKIILLSSSSSSTSTISSLSTTTLTPSLISPISLKTINDNDNNAKSNTLIGLLSLLSFICCIIYVENLNLLNPNLTKFRLTMMLTIGSPMLVSFYAWIIYSCIIGRITIVNRFLSSIAFRPISKLSYGFFLTTIVVTCYRLFSIRQTIILSAQTMFRSIVSDAVISFFFAYLMYLMIQQPLRNLLQIKLLSKKLLKILNKKLITTKQTTDIDHIGKYCIRRYSNSSTILNNNETKQNNNNNSDENDNKQDFIIDNNNQIMLNLSLNNNNEKSSITILQQQNECSKC